MESVRVCLRVRPFSENESHESVVSLSDPCITLQSDTNKEFTFDAVFGHQVTQEEVYNRTAHAIVESALHGYNGTVFAYGQTGTGKTFSMEGTATNPGIVPSSFTHIFSHIKTAGDSARFLVRASYLEIYNEEIRDLLCKPEERSKLELKEDQETGIFVKNLSWFVVKDEHELDKLMKKGAKSRSVGSTLMNERSSRSHSIFTTLIEACELREDGTECIRVGKLNLVDLAGSERQSKTGASGNRLREAAQINLSLSCLGNVIKALVDNKSSHIPYRDSKLTRLLQDSLGGSAKTVMIATISPAESNYDETLSTLRYASRAKKISNKPKINEDPKNAMLRQFQEEIMRLRTELELVDAAVAGDSKSSASSDDSEMKEQLHHENEREKIKRENLIQQIAQMESKLLVGENILEKEKIHNAEIQKEMEDLERHRQEQQELHERMIVEEAARLQIEEEYSSLQEEAEAKSEKMKKLWIMFMSQKAEVRDASQEIQRDREDLLDSIRALSRELRRKTLLIERFIPEPELEQIEANSNWSEEEGTWQINCLAFAGGRTQMASESFKTRKYIEASSDYPTESIYRIIDRSRSSNSQSKRAASSMSRPFAARTKSSGSKKSDVPHHSLFFVAPSTENIRELPPSARGLVSKPKHYA